MKSPLQVEAKSELKKTKFAPPDLLRVNEKDPRYTYRWIHTTDKMNFYNGVENRGWEIVRWGSKSSENNIELMGLFSQFAPQTVGSIMRTGDLILARMPKEKAKERNEYYLSLARKQVADIKDPKRDIQTKERDLFVKSESDSWKETQI